MTELEIRIAELERSHADLRGALIFAGRRINRLRRNDKSLPLGGAALAEARKVAKAKRNYGTVRINLASAG